MPMKPPPGLGIAGRKVWAGIWRELDAADPPLDLTFVEADNLMSACRCADVVANLQRMIESEGIAVVGSTKQLKINPAISAQQSALAQKARFLALVGMPSTAVAGKQTGAQEHARKAVVVRWDKYRQRERDAGRAS